MEVIDQPIVMQPSRQQVMLRMHVSAVTGCVERAFLFVLTCTKLQHPPSQKKKSVQSTVFEPNILKASKVAAVSSGKYTCFSSIDVRHNAKMKLEVLDLISGLVLVRA